MGAQQYDVLVLPPMDTIRLRTLAKIQQFAEEGGSVFAHPLAPTFAAEGSDKDNDIKSMMGIIAAMGGLHKPAPHSTPLTYLLNSRVPPECILNPLSSNILCKAVSTKTGKTYFLVNASSLAYMGTCTFHSTGKPPALNPDSGIEEMLKYQKVGSTRIQIELSLKPFASLFVQF